MPAAKMISALASNRYLACDVESVLRFIANRLLTVGNQKEGDQCIQSVYTRTPHRTTAVSPVPPPAGIRNTSSIEFNGS